MYNLVIRKQKSRGPPEGKRAITSREETLYIRLKFASSLARERVIKRSE